MLTGDPYFHIVPYSEEAEVFAALEQILHRSDTEPDLS